MTLQSHKDGHNALLDFTQSDTMTLPNHTDRHNALAEFTSYQSDIVEPQGLARCTGGFHEVVDSLFLDHSTYPTINTTYVQHTYTPRTKIVPPQLYTYPLR